MNRLAKVIFGLALLGLAAVIGMSAVSAETSPSDTCDRTKQAFCFEWRHESRVGVLHNVNMPKIATPEWLATPSSSFQATVTYSIATRGAITADLAEFKQQASETLNNPNGWSRLGVGFAEVESGGQFTLWLAQDVEMTGFAPSVCDSTYSCSVGNNVVINQTRWLGASDSWNGAGGSLRDYRHMVVNHEVGHWLGHGHRHCAGAGQAAPVMQQQSIDMQGCVPNPWPLSNELLAPKLGIRS